VITNLLYMCDSVFLSLLHQITIMTIIFTTI